MPLVGADRFVMAASGFLGAVSKCVILLSFAAWHRESYWSGCIKVVVVSSQQVFLIPFKKCFRIFFLRFWGRDPVLELQFLLPFTAFYMAVCNSVFVDHLVLAASKSRESYWAGCIEVALLSCQQF